MPPAPESASARAVFLEGFGRTPDLVETALEGLADDDLTRRVDPDANTIAWLVWHTGRMQDAQVTAAERALGRAADQVWTSEGYAGRFGLGFGEREVGYGMSSAQVARTNVHGPLLKAYHQAVHDRTVSFLESLEDDDYGFVLDERYDPPVTLMSRLVSILHDAVQHLGQAAYVRGVLRRTPPTKRGG